MPIVTVKNEDMEELQMGIFGFFKSSGETPEAERARIEELDRRNREARERLARTQARGCVAKWKKEFGYLQRLCDQDSGAVSIDASMVTYIKEYPDFLAHCIGSAIQKCALHELDFSSFSNVASKDLALSIRDDVAIEILSLSREAGYGGRKIEDAIVALGKHNCLGSVINYLNELDSTLCK